MSGYQQPADMAALPPWRQPASDADPPLDISVVCHVIAGRTIPALHSSAPGGSTADALSLIEELMPLLAEPARERGSAAASARVQLYLHELSHVLEQQIQTDSANSPAVAAAKDGLLDETPVLGPAAVQTLVLVARFLAFLPPGDCVDAVPSALALRLGRLCCNPTLDVLIPGWRDAVRPLLPALAPACVEAARLAEETADALQRAAALTDAAQVRWMPHG